MSPIRAVPGLDSDYSPTPQDRVLDNLINRPIPAAAQKSGIDVSNWSVQKKVEEAIKLSLPMMSAEMQKQMKELTKPENIAALAAGITALGVAHAYGIGQIVDGVLLAQFGVENTTKLLQFVVGAVTAKRGSDLQLAAKNFSDVAMNTGALLATAGLMKGSATVVKAIAAQLPKLAEIAPKTAVILSGSIGAAKLGLERSSKNLNSALVKFGNSIGSEAVTKIGQLANGTKEVLHETNQVFDKVLHTDWGRKLKNFLIPSEQNLVLAIDGGNNFGMVPTPGRIRAGKIISIKDKQGEVTYQAPKKPKPAAVEAESKRDQELFKENIKQLFKERKGSDKNGLSRKQNYQAHHIVEINDPKMQSARNILERNGIDINDGNNGVYLPKDHSVRNGKDLTVPQEAVHTDLRNSQYRQEVTKRLADAEKLPGDKKKILLRS